jgi:excisionase family DNA binding protein
VVNRKEPSADQRDDIKARITELARLFSDGVISEAEWRTARGRLEERMEALDQCVDVRRPDERRAYSVKEAARLLGVGTTTVYKLINAAELGVKYVGGRTLVPDEAITAFLGQADTERHHRRGRRPQPVISAPRLERGKATPTRTRGSSSS